MPNQIIASMLRVAQKTMEMAQILSGKKSRDLYGDGHKVERLAKALEAIQKATQGGSHSQVDILFTISSSVVDYQVDAWDSEGCRTDIAGDLNLDSFVDALIAIGEDKEIQAIADQVDQAQALQNEVSNA